jgi:hypothetical protein
MGRTPSEKEIEARQKVTEALYELMRATTEMQPDELISDWALVVQTSSMTDVTVADYYTISMSANSPPHLMEGLYRAGIKFIWESDDEED